MKGLNILSAVLLLQLAVLPFTNALTPNPFTKNPRARGRGGEVTAQAKSASLGLRAGGRHPTPPSSSASSAGPSLKLLPEGALLLAETVAPRVGILTSTLLYFSPASAVLRAVRDGDAGSLNPLPLSIMAVTSVAWLAYGLCVRDRYVALSNIAGCVGSAAYVVGLLPLLRDDSERLLIMQAVVIGGIAATLCLWTYLSLSGASVAVAGKALGLFASALFVILSGSPLSTIGTVVKNGDASSILAPLTGAQVINTSLWSAYGLAVRDRFIWGPNVVGLVLGLVQLSLKILFPSKK
eukprot:CAMPEP_0183297868 /NCGR_PEP_ID=MMETSP0160_2-20130417/5036_1 /TAXON_ID=2839 ORGANISM="Odontella Sinensis, Strain Grunow 1884" /NCGR_SAMPLE_ID=MMETSP0160_2 /ASSEMBLY_ACC=CAM_ASM_000250 /LENGTH=294 /DNA_ID=CAMNT_0025459765 /DNA_START=65 /DNA_END=949 /DNA_ORIENTATION=+